MVGSSNAPDWSDALYRGLGLVAIATMWLWLLTPLELIYSGMPLALSWSVLESPARLPSQNWSGTVSKPGMSPNQIQSCLLLV